MQSKREYLERREQQERHAAEMASHPKAREAHRELAARYAWQRELKAKITQEVD